MMQHAIIEAAPRAMPFSTKRFEAFRVRDNRTRRLVLVGDQPDLKATLDAATVQWCEHKDKLLIREADADEGTSILHVYVVKKQAAKWIHPAGEIVPRRFEQLYADPVCSIDETVLAA